MAKVVRILYLWLMTAPDFGKPFLTAEWRHLALLNYEIAAAALQPLVPRGTELDSFNGTIYVSLVGFVFLNTKVLGVAIPFHENFEEINLRFYVRRRAAEGWRRGVVFIKEIVPRPAIAWVARWLYNENYIALPTGHVLLPTPGDPNNIAAVKYYWRLGKRAQVIEVATAGAPGDFAAGSLEEYIAQHYWGYSRQKNGATLEYRVDHPPWRIWQSARARFDGDGAALYGAPFGEVLRAPPASAFLAEGSPVVVFKGQKIT